MEEKEVYSQQKEQSEKTAENNEDSHAYIQPEKVLFSWKAPARAFKRREKEFWTSIVVIGAMFGFILFIIEGAMTVILIIALIFLFYILSTVKPDEITYAITDVGIKVAESLNTWDLFTRFWFDKHYDSNVVVFETYTLTGRLELVIHDKDKSKITEVLSKYIPLEKAPPTNYDKAAEWLSQRIPGNS